MSVLRRMRLPYVRAAAPEVLATAKAQRWDPAEVLRARVRASLAGSDGWEDFAARLRLSGVLVRERYSTRDPGELTGYAVGLPTSGARDRAGQQTVWFGGGKLAPDLSLPQLRARWDQGGGVSRGQEPNAGRADRPHISRPVGAPTSPAGDLSELDRRRLWVAAESAVNRADADMKHADRNHFDAAAQATAQAAAASAAEVFVAVSWLVERKRGGHLHAAAEEYGRAARDLNRRTVPATAHSRSVRTAAGALLGARLVKRAETRQLLSLMTRLTTLSESLARLRDTQGRATQALSARRAAEQLVGEHLRRTGAAAAVPTFARQGPVSVELAPPHRVVSGPAARGASPSR